MARRVRDRLAGCRSPPPASGSPGSPVRAQVHWGISGSPTTAAEPGGSHANLRAADGPTGSCPEVLRERWRDGSRIDRYRAIQGWVDAGERRALLSVADAVRGRAVLDLGVGAGRTIPLLRLLTDDYVGLDWSPEMVQACAAAFPGIDVRTGDARDLSALPSDHFALVLFSYNGLDNLDHDGRDRALAEAARVLAPRGFLVYSTMSKLGPIYRAPPTRVAPRAPGEPVARYAGRLAYTLVTSHRDHAARMEKWRAGLGRATDHGDWATAPLEAVDFELVHFSTVGAERDALGRHGLVPEHLFTDDGRTLDADHCGYAWFHVVAQKPRDGGAGGAGGSCGAGGS